MGIDQAEVDVLKGKLLILFIKIGWVLTEDVSLV